MPITKGKVVVSTEIPESLRDDIDQRAGTEGRSRAELIGRAVRFYLRHAPVIHADAVPDVSLSPGKPGEKTTRKKPGKSV